MIFANQGQFPMLLHYYMFRLMVKNLGSEEQKERWMHDIDMLKLHGCYA